MESTNRKRRFWDYIGLLVCVISWGSAFVVVRSAAAHMTPMTMTMFRLVFAALFFLPIAVKHRHDNTPREIAACWKYLLVMSLLGAALFMFCMCVGLKYTTATNAALINGINPIVIVFAAALFARVQVKKTAILPLILSVTGAIIIIWFKPANTGGFSINAGDLFFVANVIWWAAFSVVLIPFNNRLHWSVWGVIINVLAVIMLLFLTPWFPIELSGVALADYAKVAYAGLICGGLSTALWNNAISRLGIATTALFNNLNPLSSVIFSMIFLGETMVANQFVGALLILGSLITYTLIDFVHFKQEQQHKKECILDMQKDTGIIFDMDNTILDTQIDFGEMKRVTVAAVREFCAETVAREGEDFSQLAVGQVIAWAVERGLSQEQQMIIWERISDVEAAGMQEVQAEPQAEAMLTALQDSRAELFILTNNSLRAAKLAMENSGMTHYFAEIHARDEYGETKPSPKGILAIMADHPQLTHWLMVGDSWLDGRAAQNADISFAAYGANDTDYWQNYDITPAVHIKGWCAESSEQLLAAALNNK